MKRGNARKIDRSPPVSVAGGATESGWSPLATWTPAARTVLALVVMWLGVLAVYVPVRQHPDDNAMVGTDFAVLHLRRIRFAREALFGPNHLLPAWYPRE